MLGFQLDYPKTASGAAPAPFCLRADPVFQQLDINEAILADSSVLDLQASEAAAIVSDLNLHFKDDGVIFRSATPTRWYCELPRELNLTTLSPGHATGRSVSLTMVQGEDAGVWRGWLSEIEMLLYAHPVNQARAEAGQSLINSLWLWGEGNPGLLPTPARPADEALVFSDHFYVRSISRHHGFDCQPLSEFSTSDTATNVLIVDDRLSVALATGDQAQYDRVLASFEEFVFTPLEARQRKHASTAAIWGGDDQWLALSAKPAVAKRLSNFLSGLIRRRSKARESR